MAIPAIDPASCPAWYTYWLYNSLGKALLKVYKWEREGEQRARSDGMSVTMDDGSATED